MDQQIPSWIRFVRRSAVGAAILAVALLTLIYFGPDLLRASSVPVSVPVVFDAAAQELREDETIAKVRSASLKGDLVVDMNAWEYTAAPRSIQAHKKRHPRQQRPRQRRGPAASGEPSDQRWAGDWPREPGNQGRQEKELACATPV